MKASTNFQTIGHPSKFNAGLGLYSIFELYYNWIDMLFELNNRRKIIYTDFTVKAYQKLFFFM